MKLSLIFANNNSGIKRIGAQIIREVEETPFCHFAVLIDDGFEKWIYEAVFPKSHKVKFDEWLQEYSIHTQFEIPIPSHEKLVECLECLESMINKWYSFDQCLWIAFCIWFKINEKIQRQVIFNGNSHLICTELGYLFVEKFFNFRWYYANQDRVDLLDMFQIANRISNKIEWK